MRESLLTEGTTHYVEGVYTTRPKAARVDANHLSIRLSSCLATPSAVAPVLPNKEQHELHPHPQRVS